MRTPVSGEGVEDDVIHCLPALQRYIDGALSNNLPFSDSPTTITVSPFYGTVDICPQSRSGSLYELTAFNASFQISTINFFQGFISLFPPKPEVGHPAWSWPMTPPLSFSYGPASFHTMGFHTLHTEAGGFCLSCLSWVRARVQL